MQKFKLVLSESIIKKINFHSLDMWCLTIVTNVGINFKLEH